MLLRQGGSGATETNQARSCLDFSKTRLTDFESSDLHHFALIPMSS